VLSITLGCSSSSSRSSRSKRPTLGSTVILGLVVYLVMVEA
jgi:hypothetical protein